MRQLRKSMPLGSDNLAWHEHYVKAHNKTLTPESAHLAMWYLLLHLMHNT